MCGFRRLGFGAGIEGKLGDFIMKGYIYKGNLPKNLEGLETKLVVCEVLSKHVTSITTIT